MNARRRRKGDETWNRLLNWTDSQKASERLAGHILGIEGFTSIDPSHPLGGPDGLRDMICVRSDIRWVVAVYFPNGQKSFSEIKTKFEDDAYGATKNSVQSFVFVTNQYLKIGERNKLIESAPVEHVEIYYLERIARILDAPVSYGIRLEFLDIEMTKEEQVSFFGVVTQGMDELRKQVNSFLELFNDANLSESIPIDELKEFAETLSRLASQPSFYYTSSSVTQYPPPLHQLRVPLDELKEFAETLTRLASQPSFYYTSSSITQYPPPLHQLRVPLSELREYEQTLDQVLSKLERIRDLNPEE